MGARGRQGGSGCELRNVIRRVLSCYLYDSGPVGSEGGEGGEGARAMVREKSRSDKSSLKGSANVSGGRGEGQRGVKRKEGDT